MLTKREFLKTCGLAVMAAPFAGLQGRVLKSYACRGRIFASPPMS